MQRYAAKTAHFGGSSLPQNSQQAHHAATAQMYALKHARMGGNPEAIADVKNEVDVMKAVRGAPHVLTLRAVVMQGPPGAEVRVHVAIVRLA